MKAVLVPLFGSRSFQAQSFVLLPVDSGSSSALSFEHIPERPITVFTDVCYKIVLVFDDPAPKNFHVFLNDDPISNFIPQKKGSYVTAEYQRVFDNSYGYVQLEVEVISDDKGAESCFYRSAYLDVNIPNDRLYDPIPAMFRYVRENYAPYLFPERAAAETLLNRRILLLEEIQRLYKQNFNFFRAAPYQVIDHSFMLDDFRKLSHLPYETIRYMIQHPELLRPTGSAYGILFDGVHYLPDKALIQNTVQNPDCYENEVVLGFLSTVLSEISELLLKVSGINDAEDEENFLFDDFYGYHSSTGEMLTILQAQQETMRVKLEGLRDAFEKLLWLYQSVLPVKKLYLNGQPRPSYVFLEREPYRRFYEVMEKWFRQSESEDVRQDRFVMPLLANSGLYEYYVLLKQLSALEKEGYRIDREKSCCFEYSCPDKRFRNVNHTNTFVFRHTSVSLPSVTLYYRPVIYGKESPEDRPNGIALKRATSHSYQNRDFPGFSGGFYTPDFVLKAVNGEDERYIIADAKFRRFSAGDIAEYQFKYHFSIQPTLPTARIQGILLLYGKEFESPSEARSIFDFYENPNVPYMRYTSLTESEACTQLSQNEMFSAVIRDLIQKG